MKLFFDSSIIIETFKGNEQAVNIVERIYKIENKEIYINAVVFSEVSYQLLYRKDFKKDEVFEFLNGFNFLDTNFSIISISEFFMKKYSLKPNDAIISATIKYFEIDYLVTLDNDYLNLDIKIYEWKHLS